MKGIQEILGDTKPKSVAKIDKAFAKGGCEQYKDAFMSEVLKPSARDFQNNKCIVTDNFICYYGLYAGLGSMLRVIPLEKIVNLYRSNVTITDKGLEYSYDYFNLALELDNNERVFVAQTSKNAKTMDAYNDIIAFIRGRISVMGGGASC